MRTRTILIALIALGLSDASVAADEGAQHVTTYCTVCHGDDLIHQQRLTEKQWRATVEKMVRWGAQASAEPVKDAIVSHLASHYGPDAGAHSPRRIETQAARAAVAPLPDGPFAGGDAARGQEYYSKDCIACHGPTADGQLGINLVDRYLLYRAPDFAKIMREGKAPIMPGRTVDDAGIADLLAYLRTLPK